MASYSFGIEIEMIAKPHTIRNDLQTLHALYYSKIAAALRKRGLEAASDPLRRYRKHPEHYDKWWITRDGSLGLTEEQKYTLVPIEAVSPILNIGGSWENKIDTFWTAMAAVFHQPERHPSCGSHIHMSKGVDSPFTMGDLKTIAFGIVVHETSNEYCWLNSQSSPTLQACGGNHTSIATAINDAYDANALVDVMQANRYVLWNFENTRPGGTGTIEFRGGRFLRGTARTKRWIAFAVALVHWLLIERHIDEPESVHPMSDAGFYAAVKTAAGALLIEHLLPGKHTELNESKGEAEGVLDLADAV